MNGDNSKIRNKNLERYINKMESRGKSESINKKKETEDEQRIRIFKKPLNSLGAR